MPRRLTAVFAAALILSGCSDGGQRQTSGITSVLVMKHGRITRESYYGGVEPTDRLPIFSITKSVTSALVGIAIARGDVTGLDERLPWREQITLRQLLSMTAGYAPSFDFESADAQELAARARLNRRGTFAYDAGSLDLVGAMLERATGMSLADYARRRLFGPMGIPY